MRPTLSIRAGRPRGLVATLCAASVLLAGCASAAAPAPVESGAAAPASTSPAASAPSESVAPASAAPADTVAPSATEEPLAFDLTLSGAITGKVSGTAADAFRLFRETRSGDVWGCTLVVRGDTYPVFGAADSGLAIVLSDEGDKIEGRAYDWGNGSLALADVTFDSATSSMTLLKPLVIKGPNGTTKVTGTITCPT